jgi:CDP-diacylglycerol--glycerol-3-phosphate 3-phosphatidyltransferase
MRRPSLPDLLSTARLMLVPVLWLLAFSGQRVLQGILLFVAGATDVVDGWLARRWHVSTKLGSRIDTAADMLLLASIYAWIVMYDPVIVWQHRVVVVAVLITTLTFLTVEWVRFRRFADLHLYSAKAAGLLTHAFILTLLFLGHSIHWLFDVALFAAAVGALESLLIVATRARIDEHVGTLLRRRAS